MPLIFGNDGRSPKGQPKGFRSSDSPLGVIGGTLISSAIQALFGIGATVLQNKYNSPLSQVKRLRKAGLPLAYMYRGNVANQSEVPRLSIDPSLGTAQKIASRYTATQQEDLAADIQVKDMRSGIKQDDGSELSVRGTQKMAETRIKEAESFIKKHEESIKEIEAYVEADAFAKNIPQEMKMQALVKAKQQIENLLAQEGLMEQLKKIRGLEEIMNNALTKDIDNLPQWLQGFARVLMMAFNKKL